jgi:hypothetical protein
LVKGALRARFDDALRAGFAEAADQAEAEPTAFG